MFPELDLCPKPVHQRASEGSVESETDTGNEAIQPEKSVQGAENQKGPPVVRTLRSLSEDRRIWAVPELDDERHTVTRSDGSEVTVFVAEWVPIEKIRKAVIDWKAIDWGVVRPTSRRQDKWVYFPPEDQELLRKYK